MVEAPLHHHFLTLVNWGGPLCTIQSLKPIRDTRLSSIAFKFNLRRYMKVLVIRLPSMEVVHPEVLNWRTGKWGDGPGAAGVTNDAGDGAGGRAGAGAGAGAGGSGGGGRSGGAGAGASGSGCSGGSGGSGSGGGRAVDMMGAVGRCPGGFAMPPPPPGRFRHTAFEVGRCRLNLCKPS